MNVTRRIAAILLLGLGRAARAQAPARIAFIGPGNAKGQADFLAAFKEGLREHGLTEGRHYVVDDRYAEGKYERFAALTEELLRREPDVIMVGTIASIRAAQRLTKTVPIVFWAVTDPVGNGLVASLHRPGGNTTGLANQAEEVVGKYVELLHETLPRARRLAVLVNPSNPSTRQLFEQARELGGPLGLAAEAYSAASPEGLEPAFAAMTSRRPDGLIVISEAMFLDQRERISAFGLQRRVPTVAFAPDFSESGSLFAYGMRRREMYRGSAAYVKKILAGARPADLPVEQPTRLELVVNLRTARALGLAIPRSIIVRADEVIE